MYWGYYISFLLYYKRFFFVDKLASHFKNNSVKTFLDSLNIKHAGDEIENDKFKIIEKKISPDILDLGNNKLYIVFLDNYNFHNEEKKSICYIKKDLKKSIMSISNDSINRKTNSNNNSIMNNNISWFTANNKKNIDYYSNNSTINNINNNMFCNSAELKRRLSNDPNNQNIKLCFQLFL